VICLVDGDLGMDNIRTDARLISRLRAAAGRKLTKEELRAQRISYIYGLLKDDSKVTRDRIKKVLDERDG
jgi:hypothetical protein